MTTISTQNLPSVTAPRTLTIADLNVTINHEPRILDIKLAEMLGMTRPRKIRELIARHREQLERFGDVPSAGRVVKGNQVTEYYLSKKQALYICTKSETSLATEVTIRMVEVFDEYMMGKLGKPKDSMIDYYLREAFINALNIGEEAKVAREFLEEMPYIPTRFDVEQHLQAIIRMQQNMSHAIEYVTTKLLPGGTPKTKQMIEHLLA